MVARWLLGNQVGRWDQASPCSPHEWKLGCAERWHCHGQCQPISPTSMAVVLVWKAKLFLLVQWINFQVKIGHVRPFLAGHCMCPCVLLDFLIFKALHKDWDVKKSKDPFKTYEFGVFDGGPVLAQIHWVGGVQSVCGSNTSESTNTRLESTQELIFAWPGGLLVGTACTQDSDLLNPKHLCSENPEDVKAADSNRLCCLNMHVALAWIAGHRRLETAHTQGPSRPAPFSY